MHLPRTQRGAPVIPLGEIYLAGWDIAFNRCRRVRKSLAFDLTAYYNQAQRPHQQCIADPLRNTTQHP